MGVLTHHRTGPAPDRPLPGVILMSVRRSTTRLAAVFLVPAFIVAACGGAASSSGPDGSAAAPSTGVLPSDFALPSDLVLPSFAIPSFELGGLITNLEGVDSYKVAIVTQDGTSYSGTIVTKPVVARDLYIGEGDDATHVVTIGEEAWIGEGSGPLTSAPNAMVAALIPLFNPAILLSAFANSSLLGYGQNLGEESKNGQNTTHYKVLLSDIPSFAQLGMPATAAVEVWVADDGYLVSFIATDFGAVGQNLGMDVTNVNDPANVVERPS
jgi:hypothetical protein